MSSKKESAWPFKVLGSRQHRKLKLLSLFGALLAMTSGLPTLFNGIGHAQNQDDPRDLLLHARENVLQTIQRLPKYLCTQTVDRSRYQPPNREERTNAPKIPSCDDTMAEAKRTNRTRRLFSSDRLRFDVAVNTSAPGEVGEMYSWAGEDRFGDHDLFEFVHDGSISTGSFSSMLASIFGSNAARFSYNGDSVVDGRPFSEYGFRIAQEKSRYTYVFGNGSSKQATMAYDGTILVDSLTSDLVRLVIRSDQLPTETGACELTQTLDYARVRLHDADFLLPKEARVSVVHTDGSEAENRIQYSACREFRSKSVIRFPASDGAAQSEASDYGEQVSPLLLPPGLPFKVVFTDSINTATAAAGDPIRGKLKSAIRDGSSNVLIPEGTSVMGRITSIRRYYAQANPDLSEGRDEKSDRSWVTIITGPQASTAESRNTRQSQPPLVIEIRLESVEIDGAAHPLHAAFTSGLRRFAKSKGKLPQRVEIGSLDPTRDPNAGSFELWETSPTYVVKSGLESNWVTLAQ
jgi:hypothetical protein